METSLSNISAYPVSTAKKACHKTIMVAIKSLIALLGATAVSALPTGEKLEARDTVVTASGTGTAGGYYYSNYVETGSDTFTIGTGKYSLSWSSSNTDVVSGIGWSTGSAR